MRLFQTMIFADRPREGVRLALTTLASGAILEIYPRGISPETMVPLVFVNAGAKMGRLAGAKIHRRCWQEGPELGAFSSGIRLGSDYPPRRQHWRGVNGAYFD